MSGRQPGRQRNWIGQVLVLTAHQSKEVKGRSVQPTGLHNGERSGELNGEHAPPANALNCGELQSPRSVRSAKAQLTGLRRFS